MPPRHLSTARLRLDAPAPGDVDAVHALFADPRVWTHLPRGRHEDEATTSRMLDAWISEWRDDELGTWLLRRPDEARLLGAAGCARRGEGKWWNLSYRLSPEAQGQGYAFEAATAAVERAQQTRRDIPVMALLLEHNTGSRKLAERLGLALQYSGTDGPNTVDGATRRIYADRPLSESTIRDIIDRDV